MKGDRIHSKAETDLRSKDSFHWGISQGDRKISVNAAKFGQRLKVKESSHLMDSGLYFLIENGVLYCVKWKMGRWMDYLKKEVDLTYSTW